jgi:tRNA G18 (ribose-2'-O)-methylase SpoU
VIQVATLDDPRVRDYRATARPDLLRAAGLFVAEGRLVVQRLLDASRFSLRSVLVTHAALERLRPFLETHASAVPIYVIDQDHMNEIVGFNIHRGCLALAERPGPQVLGDIALSAMKRIVVLEGVSNPDNVGGLFRNAAAFGVDLVLLGPDCADPLYRKAIRTSMGSSLLVPFATAEPWPDAIHQLKAAAFQTVALTPAPETVLLHQVAFAQRVGLVVGAEGEGLSPAVLAACDARVRIAITSRIDSLNVATAAAIALHHLAISESR